MAKFGAVCVLLVCMWLRVSAAALPPFDEDRDVEKELYVRQLAEWLAEQSPDFLNELTSFPPCRPCGYEHRQPISVVPRASYAKRNSELINSLLSLPKTMNDAGK